MKKIRTYLSGVKREMKKVKWPTKKEMVKYSVSTISFIVFFALFFTLTDVILTTIKSFSWR